MTSIEWFNPVRKQDEANRLVERRRSRRTTCFKPFVRISESENPKWSCTIRIYLIGTELFKAIPCNPLLGNSYKPLLGQFFKRNRKMCNATGEDPQLFWIRDQFLLVLRFWIVTQFLTLWKKKNWEKQLKGISFESIDQCL